jgi:DNA-binding CsgD family transcriptional regulator
VWILSELIEAAMRCGDLPTAKVAFESLTERSALSSAASARGIAARSLALLSDGEQAEGLYLEAIEQLEGSRLAVHHARAQLIYGGWLRRQDRRVDARAQLKAAYNAFKSVSADAFAKRARNELLATGERARKRTVETRDHLTAQERQIAHLAGDGLSNPEIGLRLFLSPRTVEWHLRKVFIELGIRSRRELAYTLQSADFELVAA